MTEENKNNEVHIKNPGRVAHGKKMAEMRKLAKLSKELKEAKKNGDKEIKLIKRDIAIDKQTDSKLNLHHIEVMIGIGGLLVAVIALYMQYKNKNNQIASNNNQIPPNNNLCNPYNNF